MVVVAGGRVPHVWLLLSPLLGPLLAAPHTHPDSEVLGKCWRLRKDGSCGTIKAWNTTLGRCCTGGRKRGWSAAAPLPPLHNATHQDPQCAPCTAFCHGVQCGEDQKCVVRQGRPRCVCALRCNLQHKAHVCGSDGRTYESECHLLKRACRKSRRLLVSHYGPCQTCSGVRCDGGEQCVLDEQLHPQCVKCPGFCTAHTGTRPPRPICGTDGVTYLSECHLMRASCAKNVAIPIAYKGSCQAGANCSTVRCWPEQRCLTHEDTGAPHCTFCGVQSCVSSPRAVCGSDGRNHSSWCALRHEACTSGRVITATRHHHCLAEPNIDKQRTEGNDIQENCSGPSCQRSTDCKDRKGRSKARKDRGRKKGRVSHGDAPKTTEAPWPSPHHKHDREKKTRKRKKKGCKSRRKKSRD